MRRLLTELAIGLLRPINTYAPIFVGVMTFLWGCLVLNPFTDVFKSSEVFSVVDSIGPEWLWGAIAFAVGINVVLSTIYSNRRNCFARERDSLWLCTINWFALAILLLAGNPVSTGGLVYFFVSLYSGYCYLNIKINYTDHFAKGLSFRK